MRSLGSFILNSRLHSIAIVSITAVFSFYISSIMLAMIVMRKGGQYGLQVMAGAILVTLISISVIYRLPLDEILIIPLRAWVPVWCCAMVLRATQSQAVMILTAGLFGTIFIVLLYILVDDVPLWWQTEINELLDGLVAANLNEESLQRIEQLKGDLARIAPAINPLVVSFLLLRLITVILAGRWWQSFMFNPGAFRAEFYALRLPKPMMYLLLAAMLALLLNAQSELHVVRDLLWLIIILYLFEGISCVHRLVDKRNFSSAWLVSMYGLLIVLMPYMIVLVACIGMADSWSRQRKPSPEN